MQRSIALLAASAALLSACASTGPARNSYTQEMQRLAADCAQRGGILTPVPHAYGPNPAADNVCEFRGSPPPRFRPR